ncbi:PilZ domain-containing protein [Paenibacillus silviterrae]|uniref:PilZ domain-containing protein n=1 Tax=Paenibacillus silviterrae TaxID=3242194 RepID=UPI002543480F|nr:PilZ domain-containing protein [Paenibacillus chinjuensis]
MTFRFNTSAPKKEMYNTSHGIMLNSRTAVEKKDYVATGILTYAEGDILEIELLEYKMFKLGDQVKLMVYSKGGIYTFQSTVVAMDHGALMVIIPPQTKDRFPEKREHPRIEISQEGKLQAIAHGAGSPKQQLENEVGLQVKNISISGIGFVLQDQADRLSSSSLVEMEMDLGFSFRCVAEIVRKERAEYGIYFGARYVDLQPEKVNAVRAFVLRKQVEWYFVKKRLEQKNELEKK